MSFLWLLLTLFVASEAYWTLEATLRLLLEWGLGRMAFTARYLEPSLRPGEGGGITPWLLPWLCALSLAQLARLGALGLAIARRPPGVVAAAIAQIATLALAFFGQDLLATATPWEVLFLDVDVATQVLLALGLSLTAAWHLRGAAAAPLLHTDAGKAALMPSGTGPPLPRLKAPRAFIYGLISVALVYVVLTIDRTSQRLWAMIEADEAGFAAFVPGTGEDGGPSALEMVPEFSNLYASSFQWIMAAPRYVEMEDLLFLNQLLTIALAMVILLLLVFLINGLTIRDIPLNRYHPDTGHLFTLLETRLAPVIDRRWALRLGFGATDLSVLGPRRDSVLRLPLSWQRAAQGWRELPRTHLGRVAHELGHIQDNGALYGMWTPSLFALAALLLIAGPLTDLLLWPPMALLGLADPLNPVRILGGICSMVASLVVIKGLLDLYHTRELEADLAMAALLGGPPEAEPPGQPRNLRHRLTHPSPGRRAQTLEMGEPPPTLAIWATLGAATYFGAFHLELQLTYASMTDISFFDPQAALPEKDTAFAMAAFARLLLGGLNAFTWIGLVIALPTLRALTQERSAPLGTRLKRRGAALAAFALGILAPMIELIAAVGSFAPAALGLFLPSAVVGLAAFLLAMILGEGLLALKRWQPAIRPRLLWRLGLAVSLLVFTYALLDLGPRLMDIITEQEQAALTPTAVEHVLTEPVDPQHDAPASRRLLKLMRITAGDPALSTRVKRLGLVSAALPLLGDVQEGRCLCLRRLWELERQMKQKALPTDALTRVALPMCEVALSPASRWLAPSLLVEADSAGCDVSKWLPGL